MGAYTALSHVRCHTCKQATDRGLQTIKCSKNYSLESFMRLPLGSKEAHRCPNREDLYARLLHKRRHS